MLVPAAQLSESADSLLGALCLPISPLSVSPLLYVSLSSWKLMFLSFNSLSIPNAFDMLSSPLETAPSWRLWPLPLGVLLSGAFLIWSLPRNFFFPPFSWWWRVPTLRPSFLCVFLRELFLLKLLLPPLHWDAPIWWSVPLPRAPVPSLFTVVHKTFPPYTFLAGASNPAGSRNCIPSQCWDQLVLSPLTFRSVIRTCLSRAFDWPVSLSPDPGSKLCSHLLQNVSPISFPFWVLFTTLSSSSPYLTASQPLICVFHTSLHPTHPSRLPWTSWHLLPCLSLSVSLGHTPFRLQ